jgi:Transglutaminase-like superfamily
VAGLDALEAAEAEAVTGALLALALAGLPEGRAAYRMELGGEPVGVVTLELRPDGAGRAVTWVSSQRLPAEAGGGSLERRVELRVDAEGRAVGSARVAEGGAARLVALPAGAVPALLVEAVLAARLEGALPACVEAVEELSGAPFRACARRDGGWLRLDLGPERESVRPGADGFAEEVVLPGQRTRFVRDARATVPERPPRLFGVEVAGPDEPERGARFCGVPRDGRTAAVPASLPAPRAEGASCREQAATWLRGARAAGWRGRTAVGVAWSGAAWSWHAWAEVRVGAAWVPVDPSFGQAPASSPRFTLATWDDGDEAARAEAGRRVLACWGRSRVEP